MTDFRCVFVCVGSVYGAVIVNGCEHLQVTVTCRKLVIINCLECTFHLACASSVVVIGDCRALYVGPLNSHYKNLPGHVKHAELASLLEGGGTNCWNMLCDVNHCLSDGATLSLEHNPQHRGVVFELPAPQAVMASLLPPEKFRVASVPVRGEHAGFEVNCCMYSPTNLINLNILFVLFVVVSDIATSRIPTASRDAETRSRGRQANTVVADQSPGGGRGQGVGRGCRHQAAVFLLHLQEVHGKGDVYRIFPYLQLAYGNICFSSLGMASSYG